MHTKFDNIQKNAYYLAFQISCSDYLLFFNLLKSFGVPVTDFNNHIDENLLIFLDASKVFNIY